VKRSIFDSHSHIDAPEFDPDRDEVIGRAQAAGVLQQLVPAIDHAGWPKLKSICAAWPGLFPAYGLHPMFLDRHRPEHLEALQEWIGREQPKAVGECGLDFFVDGLDPQVQRMYFRRQLEIARDFDLPVVLHARRAVEEVIATIRSVGRLRGVIHSYSGSEEQAMQLFGMGFLLGIGGPVTYERAKRLRRIAGTVPLECLLLETDSPDQPDSQHRGRRNEPALIVAVLESVAGLRRMDAGVLADATCENARRLFGVA